MLSFACTYCDRQIYSDGYYCKCQPDVVVCSFCKKIQCGICSKQLTHISTQKCDKCWSYFPESKIFNISDCYINYCVKCSYQKYLESNGKPIKINYRKEIRRQSLFNFIKNYCSKCFKSIDQSLNYQNSAYQNDVTKVLCQDCMPLIKKQGQQRYMQKQDQKINLKNQVKQQMSLQQGGIKRQKPVNQKLSRRQIYQNWKNIQKKFHYADCMSCGYPVYQYSQDAIITTQIIICEICSRRSKIQQNQIQRQNKIIRNESNNSKIYDFDSAKKKQDSSRYQFPNIREQINIDNIIFNKNNKNDNKQKEIERRQIQIQQQSNKQDLKQQQKLVVQLKQNNQDSQAPSKPDINLDGQKQPQKAEQQIIEKQHQIIQKPKNLSKIKQINNKQPTLKRLSSQTQLFSLKMQLQITKDEELIQCANCLMELQPTASIWQETNNVPLCRCCFVDSIEQLRKDIQRRKQRRLDPIYNRRILYRQKYPQQLLPNTSPYLTDKKKQGYLQSLQRATKTEQQIKIKQNNFFNQERQQKQNKLKNTRNEILNPNTDSQKKNIHNRMSVDQKGTFRSNGIKQMNNTSQKIQKKFDTNQINPSKNLPYSYTKKFDYQKQMKIRQQQKRHTTKPKTQYVSFMNSSKICCKCGNFSVISDKYKIGDKLICIECKSNESLALKGRIKH